MIEQGRGIVSVGVLVCGRACTSSHHFVTSSGGLKTIHWQQPTVNSKQSIEGYRFHRKKIIIRTAVYTFTRLQLSKGAFHLAKISGISGSAVNGTRFAGSSHWKIPRKSGKSKKVGPFPRLEFPNGMSCSIYVSRSLYQFQVHRRAPRRTGVYDQMEQLFTNRKFHFCSHRNFRRPKPPFSNSY